MMESPMRPLPPARMIFLGFDFCVFTGCAWQQEAGRFLQYMPHAKYHEHGNEEMNEISCDAIVLFQNFQYFLKLTFKKYHFTSLMKELRNQFSSALMIISRVRSVLLAKLCMPLITSWNSFTSSLLCLPGFTCPTSPSTLKMGSTSLFLLSLATCLNTFHMSFSAEKYSIRSPGLCTLLTRPQSMSARMFMLALPREILSSSMISSVLSGSGETINKAWSWAMVRLMPQLEPSVPQACMNFSFASLSSTAQTYNIILNFQYFLKIYSLRKMQKNPDRAWRRAAKRCCLNKNNG